MNRIYLLKNIFQTKTFRHFLITSGGTAVNGLLGLIFYIAVARIMGPGIYGVLAVAIASMALVADIADLGVDTGVMRFVSKYHLPEKETALRFIKLGLEIKVMVWLVIFVGGWNIAPFMAEKLFLKPELVSPLRFALFGAGGAMIFSLTTHALQAYQKFWSFSITNISMNGLRLVGVGVLILMSAFTMESVLYTYIAIPFLGFFTTLFLLPNFLAVKREGEIKGEFFHYSKWVGLVGILAATSSRLDTFISARFLSVDNLGIYAAANQITIVVPQIIFALATVVAPKLSGLDSHKKAIAYLKKLQLLTGGLFILGILTLPLASFLIPVVLGQAYLPSVTPFIILFIAQLIFLLALPSHQAIYYYFSNPRFFTWIGIGQILITGLGGWMLISNFGIIGAAITVLISNLFNLIVPGLWVIYRFLKYPQIE